jgi:hypothetical protein
MNSRTLITIRDIEQSEYGGVYAVNATPAANRSQITFTVNKLSGDGFDNVFIPATAVPVELTTMCTKRQLLNSSEFRRALALKLITLISESAYGVMMAEDGSHEEQRRALGEMTAGTPVELDFKTGTASATVNDEKAALMEDESEENRVHPQVQAIVLQLGEEELTERDALTKLRNMGELNLRSYKYISKNTKEHTMIQNWIKRVREERYA